MIDWYQEVLDFPEKRINCFDADNILRCSIRDSESLNFHNNYSKGAFLRKLKKVQDHQINWETPYYNSIISSYLNNADLSSGTVLDLGCGDGRFAELLLQNGAKKIVCVDFDLRLLQDFAGFVRENNFEENVLLIHAGWDDLPIRRDKISLILAIGVLYYSNERYEEAIHVVHELLVKEGIALISEPDMEGFLIRSLFLNGLTEMIETFKSRSFRESTDESAPKFRLFTEGELRDIFIKAGFDILECKGISMFHNLIRVLNVKGQIASSELNNYLPEVKELFDFLEKDGRLFKHILWKLRKRNSA